MLSGTRRRSGAMRSRPRMTSCRMRSRLASGSAKPHSPPSPGPSVALPTPTAPSGTRVGKRRTTKTINHSVQGEMVRCARDEAPHHDQHAPPHHHRHAEQRARVCRLLHPPRLCRRLLPALCARCAGVGMIVAGELGHEEMQSEQGCWAAPPRETRDAAAGVACRRAGSAAADADRCLPTKSPVRAPAARPCRSCPPELSLLMPTQLV